ncbi:unnamed protein product, partial [Polarella glacialis]
MAASTKLPFFVRDKEALKVFGFDTASYELDEKKAAPFPLPTPKAAHWSPDGLAVAMVDPAQGPQVATFEKSNSGRELSTATLHSLPGAPKTVQGFLWSPLSSAVVTTAPSGPKGSQEHNVHVWRRAGAGAPGDGSGNGGSYELQASFCHPKLEKDKK